MTKEERQEMLALMQEVVSPIVKSAISEELKPINDRLDKMETQLLEVKQAQARTDILIENQIDKSIKTIAEGHSIINRKLDKEIELEIRVETVEHKVSAIEYAMGKAE